MDNSLFVNVKEIVTQWIKDNEGKFKSQNIMIEVVENNAERLFVIFNFGECMAEIIVGENDFAPYRFVAFEAVSLENGVLTILYSWYDKEGDTIEEIITNLDKAIDVTLEYNISQGTASV